MVGLDAGGQSSFFAFSLVHFHLGDIGDGQESAESLGSMRE